MVLVGQFTVSEELKKHLKSHVHRSCAFLPVVKETALGFLATDFIPIGNGNTTGISQSVTSHWVLFSEQVNRSDSPLQAALKQCEGLSYAFVSMGLGSPGCTHRQFLQAASHSIGETGRSARY